MLPISFLHHPLWFCELRKVLLMIFINLYIILFSELRIYISFNILFRNSIMRNNADAWNMYDFWRKSWEWVSDPIFNEKILPQHERTKTIWPSLQSLKKNNNKSILMDLNFFPYFFSLIINNFLTKRVSDFCLSYHLLHEENYMCGCVIGC